MYVRAIALDMIGLVWDAKRDSLRRGGAEYSILDLVFDKLKAIGLNREQ